MHFEFLNNYKFIPFAHRGGSLESTENTLDSFQHSINLGYEYIETDVRPVSYTHLTLPTTEYV